MASKINKKFIIVAGGFTAAACLLLAAVIYINVNYLQNADRHIRTGDEQMAQGKVREAYLTYGRAVSKKPSELKYLDKMEEALAKTVAQTPGQALEDYRALLAVKRARTRAQPGDPAQWQQFLDVVEAETEMYDGGTGWLALEGVAKEMKDVMAAGTPGAQLAQEYFLFARAQREQALSGGDRTELERQLEEMTKSAPKSWRAWTALATMRMADALRMRDSGQGQAATKRTEQVEKTVDDMRKALAGADGMAAVAMATIELERLRLDVRSGGRIDTTKLDQKKVKPAVEALAAAALKSESGRIVRASASLMAESGYMVAANELIATWVSAHPDDLLAASFQLEMLSRTVASDTAAFERIRKAAEAILAKPQLPTGLMANAQADVRGRSIQLLIDGILMALQRDPKAKENEGLTKELDRLRVQLLEVAQNDENAPRVVAADAKILQVKGDLAGAAKKWELYFTKVPTPAAEAFMGAASVARAQGDLGLALQRATKGTELHPGDLRLALMRAELSEQLGRFPEAASFYEAVARAIPDNQELARKAVEVRNRSKAVPESSKDLEAVQAAAEAKDWAKARELVAAWVESSGGTLPALYAQAVVESQAGTTAKALEYARAALVKFPGTLDLARLEAALATNDPVERVEMVIQRLVSDPKQQVAERVRAYRSLRADIERQITASRISAPGDTATLEATLARLQAKLAEAEKVATAQSGDDPGVIESAFNDAIERRDFAAAEAQAAAAGKQKQLPELEVVLRAQLLDSQGKTAEGIALLERARAAGRNEAPVASRLAALQERVGNEPAALALWKEAYDRRPNDMANVRGYARALSRSGQGRSALEIVRAAAAANPVDLLTQAQAAQFEAVYGSRARAAQIRSQLYRASPTDRENIADLYALLYQPAEPESVVDQSGRRRFEAREWAAIPIDERRRLLEDAAARNAVIAEQLYEASMKAMPDDLRLPAQKARIMRDIGTPEKGTAALEALIAGAESRKHLSSLMLLEYGGHLLASGNEAGAEAAFKRAATLQDPVKREVDFALVEMEARRNRVPAAIEALQRAMGDKPTLSGMLRLADLQVVARRYDDAAKSAQEARRLAGASPDAETQRTLELLIAGVAAGHADELVAKGQKEEANAKIAIAMDALGKAAAIAPTDYMAPLRRVQLMRTWARATSDAAKTDAAIVEADRLLARNTLLWPVVSVRSDLALDKRDVQGAIGIVDRFVQAQPMVDEGRSRLVDMHALSGNLARAIEVARAGADLAPQNVFWAQRLGELLATKGEFSAAAKEYDRAITMQPSNPALFAAAADARLNGKEAAEALAMLRSRNDLVTSTPVLRAYAALALSETGRRDEAAVAARESLVAARASKTPDITTEEVLRVLRRMFPPERTADYEALLTQTGAPTPLECVTLAEAWTRAGPAGADKAIAWSDKTMAGGDKVPAPIRGGAMMARGTALYSKGDMAGACDAFTAAADLSPGNPSALNNAAYLQLKVKGDAVKGLAMAQRAVTISPGQPEYLDTLGYAQLKSGQLPQAEESLNRANALGASASSLMHLAQVKAAGGKTAEAQQLLDRAREKATDPDTKKEIEEIAASIVRK